jgi:putative ABC transport system permease protein
MRDDFGHAIRHLIKRRGLAAVVTGTLALGIGAATVAFSLLHQLVLSPLPYPQAHRLIHVWELTPEGERFSMSPPTYEDLRREVEQHPETFAAVGAHSELLDGLVLTGDGEPERLQAAAVSATLLPLLRAPFVAGRSFTPEADAPGAELAEVVLSESLWVGRYQARPDILGRPIVLDGRTFTVVGVVRRGFEWPAQAEVWIPLAADPAGATLPDRDDKWLSVVGRLAPNASIERASAVLEAFGRRVAEQYPDANSGWSLTTMPLEQATVAVSTRALLWALVGAVGCLLLLTCSNVAGLLLTNGARRMQEFRLRATLGASPWRLIRLLLVESSVLGSCGAGFGLLLAYAAIDLVRTHARHLAPRVEHLQVDVTALGVALGLTITCCVIIGTMPALQAARVNLREGLDGLGRTTAFTRSRLRQGLLVAEIGLALVLMAAAGLLVLSLARLSAVDPGFATDGVLTLQVDLAARESSAGGTGPLLETLEGDLASLPGVRAVGASTTNPWRQFGFSNTVTPVERAADAPPSGLLSAQWRSVTPGFFEALDVPLLRGDRFPSVVRPDGERIVIVSASLAERLWPGTDPIGRRILWGGVTGEPRTVVGVVGDIRDVRVDGPVQPMLFVPHAQVPIPAMTLLVRTTDEANAPIAQVRQVLRTHLPGTPVAELQDLAGGRQSAAAGRQVVTVTLGAMAAVGLVLAMSGIYALLASAVVQRRREMAIRIAVGSQPRQVAGLVVRDGLTLAVVGLALGLGGVWALGRFLQSALYGVDAHDPIVIGAMTAALLGVALLASYVPARAAARLNPVEVLRSE